MQQKQCKPKKKKLSPLVFRNGESTLKNLVKLKFYLSYQSRGGVNHVNKL